MPCHPSHSRMLSEVCWDQGFAACWLGRHPADLILTDYGKALKINFRSATKAFTRRIVQNRDITEGRALSGSRAWMWDPVLISSLLPSPHCHLQQLLFFTQLFTVMCGSASSAVIARYSDPLLGFQGESHSYCHSHLLCSFLLSLLHRPQKCLV